MFRFFANMCLFATADLNILLCKCRGCGKAGARHGNEIRPRSSKFGGIGSRGASKGGADSSRESATVKDTCGTTGLIILYKVAPKGSKLECFPHKNWLAPLLAQRTRIWSLMTKMGSTTQAPPIFLLPQDRMRRNGFGANITFQPLLEDIA